MVGDGVNDAPALRNIPYFIALSCKARKTMFANLAFSSGVIVVLILSVLGLNLPLPLSVIGYEGSTVLVSLTGLRLLGYRRETRRD